MSLAQAVPVVTREAIERDATAVLAFDDGTRIPVDRFIVRTFCGVLGRLLADSAPPVQHAGAVAGKAGAVAAACAVDAHGRTVLPLPAQDPGPYWLAMDLLHGARLPWQLGLGETAAVMRCLEFLGTTSYDLQLESRLWVLLAEDEPLHAVLEHAPRLLRNTAVAPCLVRRLIQLRWKWADFRRDVLASLQADAAVVAAVMQYAPNFFPPALVLDWCLRAWPHLTPDVALRLASLHGVMYHPAEVRSVLRRVADLLEARGWDAPPAPPRAVPNLPGSAGLLTPLLRMTDAALDKYDCVPWPAHKVHGSLVKYHDVAAASVCVALEATPRPPRRVKLAPWLHMHADDARGRQLRFRPRAMDSTSTACTAVQLRVMAFDHADQLRADVAAEAWFLFAVDDDAWLDLDAATEERGDVVLLRDMLRAKAARLLRLDFFFGPDSVLDTPFDVQVALK